jgi:hypothetical protein
VTPDPATAWTVKAASARAQREWDEASTAEPQLMAAVRERLRHRPLDRSDNPNRTHRLRPPIDFKKVDGRKLPQWQHEITSTGRVHYCPDKVTRTVWVTMVNLSHPKETE